MQECGEAYQRNAPFTLLYGHKRAVAVTSYYHDVRLTLSLADPPAHRAVGARRVHVTATSSSSNQSTK